MYVQMYSLVFCYFISAGMFQDFYVATKFALEGFVGCLAPYLLQFNIR